jgi:hypothetical protein
MKKHVNKRILDKAISIRHISNEKLKDCTELTLAILLR